MISDLPVSIALLICYTVIIYFGTGLDILPVDKFFVFFGFCLLVQMNGSALGFLVSAASPSVAVAGALGTPILIVLLLFGGFYGQSIIIVFLDPITNIYTTI